MKVSDERNSEFRTERGGVKYMFRGPNLDWGVIHLLPGDALGPHRHRKVEETFYFTGGEGVLVVDGEEHPAKQGIASRWSSLSTRMTPTTKRNFRPLRSGDMQQSFPVDASVSIPSGKGSRQ